VTVRENTERPETIKIGSNKLAGTDPKMILKSVKSMYGKKGWENPFGDGKTGKRIVNIIMEGFNG
jgi:UDP-N-acetylglucosamine 2-epimerase (non-hydrolysing)